MLEKLARQDSKWQKMALYLCGNECTAKDIVQDMYLKIYELGKSEVNKYYVYLTLKSIYFNMLKQKKEMTFTEINDERIIEIADCSASTNDREMLNEALKELPFFDREILLHTSERSLRKNEKYLKISYGTLFYSRKNALKKLSDTKILKEYRKHG